MKKVWNILTTLFVWLMVLSAAAMTVFTLVSLKSVNARDRNLFGCRAFIVQSDSMSATDFKAGDLIFSKEVDPSTLQPGDIIAFISRNSHNYGETVTHKIRSLTTDEKGEPAFVTYGTTTGTDDEAVVTYDSVLGKYVGKLPGIGIFFAFLKTPKGYFSVILIPFLLIIGCCLFHCIQLARKYRTQEEQEYKDAIARERQQTEQLRRELERLQARMTGEASPKPGSSSGNTPAPNETPSEPDEFDIESIIAEFSPRGKRKL